MSGWDWLSEVYTLLGIGGGVLAIAVILSWDFLKTLWRRLLQQWADRLIGKIRPRKQANAPSPSGLITGGIEGSTLGNIGGDVTVNTTISSGLTPLELAELSKTVAEAASRHQQAPPAVLEKLAELSGRLGVQDAALTNFFQMLGHEPVGPEHLDRTLREWAEKHRQLLKTLKADSSDQAAIQALKSKAAQALEQGDYRQAEQLLIKAETEDLNAAKAAKAADEKYRLGAARTKAARAELKSVQLDYPGAATLFAAAAELLPEGQEDIAADYRNQAGTVYLEAGDYTEAEKYWRQALQWREINLPADAPSLGSSLNNLALLYGYVGRFEEAEPLHQRALEIQGKIGPDHPDTATCLNNLALLYSKMGRFEEAEPLYRRAVKIQEKTGPAHPHMATSLNNLALLYSKMGCFEEAEPLHQRALEIQGKTGPDHPNMAINLNGLASLYYEMGRFEEAESLYQRALAIVTKSLGENHPTTKTVRKNLEKLKTEKASQ